MSDVAVAVRRARLVLDGYRVAPTSLRSWSHTGKLSLTRNSIEAGCMSRIAYILNE